MWAHISSSLQGCWEITGDCWETTDRFVISYINQMPSYPWVSLMGLWKRQMLQCGLANDISSPACINGVSAKLAEINTSWILLVLTGFSTGLTDQSACHFAVRHSTSQPSPVFVYLHTDHWTRSYIIALFTFKINTCCPSYHSVIYSSETWRQKAIQEA